MSEEEKRAIEYFEQLVGIDKKYKYRPIIVKTTDNTRREFKILLNYINKLQKEIKNADERNYISGLDFIHICEKLGLESFGIQSILLGIDELQKENENLNKKNKRYEKYLKNKDIEHEKVLEYIETEKERDFVSKDKIRKCIDTKINIVIDDRLNSKDIIQIAIDRGIEEILKMIRQELLGG